MFDDDRLRNALAVHGGRDAPRGEVVAGPEPDAAVPSVAVVAVTTLLVLVALCLVLAYAMSRG